MRQFSLAQHLEDIFVVHKLARHILFTNEDSYEAPGVWVRVWPSHNIIYVQ